MAYDASNDHYIDPAIGILRNIAGAKTQAELDRSEADVTPVIIATLTQFEPPVLTEFNKQLLQDIHREIFNTIYDWAGEFRTIDIGKETAYFAHADYIDQSLEGFLRNLDIDIVEFSRRKKYAVEIITKMYSELNAIHPFREGNGRAIRSFVRLFAINHGWDIEWHRMNPDENIAACVEAMSADEILMRLMFEKLLVRY
ncbi:hypothetical protein A2707_06015 [Candidatus Saccharibacteria bacterium RIFCSPHIGHO2_01_FULL_45_15]|nr:MAG: hypothetical protein A2707_06015 [Candidatus Saccharibacteria bacterium RIFCSPHIGHO2_01_FULL_45_15]OGL29000.1 MAG: hypothetical protein A3C39_06240 [Candidatus Saccharibacteria bacterium RIFCSPHIGHO2_02_FULL_46_12]OGL32015.1 MAG: hypothetical protein A3E76_01960 [Candidatus Saccharibacteria bacterium RIFCSPHIGHO2_12_FULL_44_22]